MPSPVRFGIIGCGEIAVQTCLAISASENASITMLMDAHPAVLADLGEMYSASTTTALEDVLASPDVDAVYIATPHHLHATIGIQAAHAGKHVLVEKPITTTLADADALIDACRAKGVRLGVAYLAQTNRTLAQARDLVRAGLLGDIISTRLSALGDKPSTYWTGGYSQRVATDWRVSKAKAGGGVLIMNLSHDLNTLRWVTGLEVARVYAEADTLATPDVEVEDTIGAVLRYTNGAIGTLQGGSAFPGRGHNEVRGPRVYGTKGQLVLSAPVSGYFREPVEGAERNAWVPIGPKTAGEGRQELVEGFAAAVLGNHEPPVSGLDGRKALEIALAVYRSAEAHQPVELPLQ